MSASGGGILSLALPISSFSLMARSGFRLIEPMILNIKQNIQQLTPLLPRCAGS
jgi:hypothetical protein